MTRFTTSVRRFLKDESGVLLAEALILMPILIWGFLALVVYWDLFRVMNVSQKAAYSIADLLSRQGVVTEGFIDGQEDILEFLTPGADASRLRITSLQMNEGPNNPANPVFDGNDDFCLVFSRSSNDVLSPPYTQSELKALAPQIPNMNDLESIVLVETWVDYSPDFDTGVLNAAEGVAAETFYQFIVTRPRNWRRVTLDGQAHTCP
jgi:Flp pilus assembly protein TadG